MPCQTSNSTPGVRTRTRNKPEKRRQVYYYHALPQRYSWEYYHHQWSSPVSDWLHTNMPSLPSQILPFLPQAARKPLVSLVLPYPPFRPPLPLTTNTYQYLPVLAPVSNPSHTLTQYTVKLMVTATLWYTTSRR